MSEITPATADELAAFYLRGRDVACPGCGYNRREGLTAGCPECGAALTNDFVHMRFVRLQRRTVSWLAWLVIGLSLLLGSQVGMHIFQLYLFLF